MLPNTVSKKARGLLSSVLLKLGAPFTLVAYYCHMYTHTFGSAHSPGIDKGHHCFGVCWIR